MMGIVLIVIVALFFIAAAVAVGIATRTRGRSFPACGKCRYDVSGSIGVTARCPECGSAFAEVGILPPRVDSQKAVILIVVVVLVLIVLGAAIVTSAVMAASAAEARARARAAMIQQQLQVLKAQERIEQELMQMSPEEQAAPTTGEEPAEP